MELALVLIGAKTQDTAALIENNEEQYLASRGSHLAD